MTSPIFWRLNMILILNKIVQCERALTVTLISMPHDAANQHLYRMLINPQKNNTNKMSFAERVYEIVKAIKKGSVMTYKEVAESAGCPKAYRAVGTVLNKNKDPATVPCHRVVRCDGYLGGYAFGGIKAKKEILVGEGVVFDGDKVKLDSR